MILNSLVEDKDMDEKAKVLKREEVDRFGLVYLLDGHTPEAPKFLAGVTYCLGYVVPPRRLDWHKKISGPRQEKILNETADIGKELENLITADLQGQVSPISEKLQKPFENWIEMKEKHKIKLIGEPQTTVASFSYGFAGTIDYPIEFDGQKMIADLKSGSMYGYKKGGVQLAAYRQAYWETFGLSFEEYKNLGTVILGIHRDGTIAKPVISTHHDYQLRRFFDCLEQWKHDKFWDLQKIEWPWLKKDSHEEYFKAEYGVTWDKQEDPNDQDHNRAA